MDRRKFIHFRKKAHKMNQVQIRFRDHRELEIVQSDGTMLISRQTFLQNMETKLKVIKKIKHKMV